MKDIERYFQKTYAGWLGKNIGIRLGSPVEGWSAEQIKKTYGEVTHYLVTYQDYAADDDSNGPAFFVRALIDYSHAIDKITEKEMGNTWLNYVPEEHGFFWWGGYGISSEHTAYQNLCYGIDAPQSGAIEQNGKTCAEQIGGQIFSDCWGFVAPGNPQLAARYAEKMARVSHDGEGVYGGMFIAACISAAYVQTSIHDIIQAGLSVIPAHCQYAIVVKSIIAFHQHNPDNWRACLSSIHEHYGYDKYRGVCHIIPNAALIILSLLYGNGDFSLTQCICCMCGWDTDCNAGNVGAITGVFTGVQGIEHKWYSPINDLHISSSVIGGLNISTIAQDTAVFCRLGLKIADIKIPAPWQAIMESRHLLLHFNFIHSTQSLRITTNLQNTEASIQNTDVRGKTYARSLKIHADNMTAKSIVRVFLKTYYQPADLHDSRYDPAFTPIVFPGQSIHAVLTNKSNFPVNATLFAYDHNHDTEYHSQSYTLTKRWSKLTFTIPAIRGGLIQKIGISLQKPSSKDNAAQTLNVYMDSMECFGTPQYTIDFQKEQIEHYGFHNGTCHTEISQFTYLSGLWELEDNYISGSCHKAGEAYTGYYHAENYEFQCTLIPQIGVYHLINVRVQGAMRSYACGFYGENTVALLKKTRVYTPLVTKPFPFTHKQKYVMKIHVIGDTLCMYIDDTMVLKHRDMECRYWYGQIGLTVLDKSHCHYQDIIFQGLSQQYKLSKS